MAQAVGAHAVEQADMCRVLMEARTLAAYEPQIAASVEASEEETQRARRDRFQAGVDAGEWPSDTDVTLAALMFASSLYGLMARWHQRPGSFSWEAAAAALVSAPPARRVTEGHHRGASAPRRHP